MTARDRSRSGRQLHAPLFAVGLILSAHLIWTVHDTAMKGLTADYSIPQILFFGRLFAVPLGLVLTLRHSGLSGLRPRKFSAHLLRAGFGLVDMLCFTGAIALTSLANAITITFAAPLIMALLSVVALKEKVSRGRWGAVALGFFGVLVVLQPSGAGFGPAAWLALGSAFSYAVFLILTRAMTAHEPVPAMIFWNSALVMLATALAMIPDWKTPTASDWPFFLFIACTGAAGQYTTTEAFRRGEASLLGPMQYSALIWAALLGFIFFGDVPTFTLLAGAAIIICSQFYMLRLERT